MEFVKIESQEWMTRNLNVDKFRNGDLIDLVSSFEDWRCAAENKKPVCCFYNFNQGYESKYGRLYNWYAVSDSRILAPDGTHIPSDEEWNLLTDNLGGTNFAGNKLKCTSEHEQRSTGNNESGFSGLLGGYLSSFEGFYHVGGNGYWWSRDEADNESAWRRALVSFDSSIYKTKHYKHSGLSIRCLKD